MTEKLKLDNKAIDKYKVDTWSYIKSVPGQADKTIHPTRKYIPFDVPKKTKFKGLQLCIIKSTLNKFFTLRYWIGGKCKIYTLGKFDLEAFGVKEVEQKLETIVKKHTNDKGHWIKDPAITDKEKERKITIASFEEAQKKTVNEVIEELIEAELPKTKNEGTLASDTAREQVRFLIGYNARTNHLTYFDDQNGNGHIGFKPDYKRRAKAPETWADFWKQYKPGSRLKSGKKRSMYDTDFGKYLIEDIKSAHIVKYMADASSYSYKKHLVKTFKTLWYFAKDKGYLGTEPGIDPTLSITIKKPTALSDKSINSKYNDKVFSKEQISDIMKKLIEISPNRPFTAEAILFILISGQRESEVLKLKKNNLTIWETPQIVSPGTPGEEKIYGVVEFPAGITKRRNKGKKVYINEPMLSLFKQIQDIYKQPGYEQLRLIPWLFPNPTRINKKRLNDQERDYIFGELTRLKTLRSTWEVVRNDLSIDGVVRMFRKTFVTLGKNEAGLTNTDMKPLSNHDQERTIDLHYDKTLDKTVMTNAGKIAKVYMFPTTKTG